MTLSNNTKALRVAVTAHCEHQVKSGIPCAFPACDCTFQPNLVRPILSALDPIIAEAVAKERERCARIIEANQEAWSNQDEHRGTNGFYLKPRQFGNLTGLTFAAAIRETDT